MSFRVLRTCRRVALAVAVAATTALFVPGTASAAWGETPGTYANWSAPENPTSFTIPMTLQVSPGDYNAYWSTQFGFTDVDAAGYFGFQTHSDGGGMFLASVWNGASATPGSEGTYCQNFDEGGTGKTCRWNVRPEVGHEYELTVSRNADETAWTFTIDDTTDGTETVLGTIRLAGKATLASHSFVSWTEYYDWNNPKTVCSDAEYSKLLFGIPRTDKGDGRYTATSTSKTCQDMSRVTLGDDGATEENGPLPVAPTVPPLFGSLGSSN